MREPKPKLPESPMNVTSGWKVPSPLPSITHGPEATVYKAFSAQPPLKFWELTVRQQSS